MLWKVKWNTWSVDLSRKDISFLVGSHPKPIHYASSRQALCFNHLRRWESTLFLKALGVKGFKISLDSPFQGLSNHLKKKFPLVSNLGHLYCDLRLCFSPSIYRENRKCWLPFVLIKSNYFQEYLKLYTSCKLNACVCLLSGQSKLAFSYKQTSNSRP